jgi:hypothetical protein
MPKMSNAALGRMLNPTISGQMVGQLKKRGMPHDPAGAAAWRQRNLDPRYSKECSPRYADVRAKAPVEPAADPGYAASDIEEWFAYALERASVELIALLHVEAGLPLERGDVAFSCVATALSTALQEDLPDNDLASLTGPTAPTRSDYDQTYARASIAVRVQELQAAAAADA